MESKKSEEQEMCVTRYLLISKQADLWQRTEHILTENVDASYSTSVVKHRLLVLLNHGLPVLLKHGLLVLLKHRLLSLNF